MVRIPSAILVKPGQVLWLKDLSTRRLVRIEELISNYRAWVVDCDAEGYAKGDPILVSRKHLELRESFEGEPQAGITGRRPS